MTTLAASQVEAPLRFRRPQRLLGPLVVVLIVIAALSASLGAVHVTFEQMAAVFLAKLGLSSAAIDPMHEAVLFQIRLPRILLGALVGGGLAASGAALQGLFRNPLVDPGLIGSSSGAALAAASVIVLGGNMFSHAGRIGSMALPLASFVGAMVATWTVYRLSRVDGRTEVTTLLLLGIAMNAIAGVGIGLLTFAANDIQLRNLTFWTLGSVAGASWMTDAAIALCIVPSTVLLIRTARELNVIALGEREAGHLGINVEQMKRRIVALSALSVGAAVSASGVIGFIGLIAPHLLRLSGGPDHRNVIPGAAAGGAALVVGADLVARLVVAPAELPIGTVTAALGAPIFIALILQRRGRSGW